jgi:hypothetical protein
MILLVVDNAAKCRRTGKLRVKKEEVRKNNNLGRRTVPQHVGNSRPPPRRRGLFGLLGGPKCKEQKTR